MIKPGMTLHLRFMLNAWLWARYKFLYYYYYIHLAEGYQSSFASVSMLKLLESSFLESLKQASLQTVSMICVISWCCVFGEGPSVRATRRQASGAFLEAVQSQECLVWMVHHRASLEANTQSQGSYIHHRTVALQCRQKVIDNAEIEVCCNSIYILINLRYRWRVHVQQNLAQK